MPKALEVPSPVLPKELRTVLTFASLTPCVTQLSRLSGNFIRLFFQISGIAINCHACAYMNDDGKCLRGEGVCTTQNSQQCMLKKIFEGRSNYLG